VGAAFSRDIWFILWPFASLVLISSKGLMPLRGLAFLFSFPRSAWERNCPCKSWQIV